jgi:hypothetical protein
LGHSYLIIAPHPVFFPACLPSYSFCISLTNSFFKTPSLTSHFYCCRAAALEMWSNVSRVSWDELKGFYNSKTAFYTRDRAAIWSSDSASGHYPKERKAGYNRDTNVHCRTIHNRPHSGNNPDALQLMNGSRNCGVYIHNGVLLRHKE